MYPFATFFLQEVLKHEERAKLCKNLVSRKLLEIMQEKQTNLCLSADTQKSSRLLKVINLLIYLRRPDVNL